MRAVPIAADRIPMLDRNRAAAAAIPLKRNPIPPIIVSIAIIVTPRGLSFFVFSCAVLGQILHHYLEYNLVSQLFL